MYIPPEIRAHLEEVERRSGYLWKFLDVAGKQVLIGKLEEQMTAPNFWDSQKSAQKVISECNGYKTIPPRRSFPSATAIRRSSAPKLSFVGNSKMPRPWPN